MFFEDFTLQQSYQVGPITVTKEQILDFCRLYDPLPLHIDEEYAETTRYKGIISSGVLSFMLMWVEFLRCNDPFGSELVAGMENHMKWSLPIYPGDQLSGTMEIAELAERGKHNGIVTFLATAYNQNAQKVMEARFKVLMRRRPKVEA